MEAKLCNPMQLGSDAIQAPLLVQWNSIQYTHLIDTKKFKTKFQVMLRVPPLKRINVKKIKIVSSLIGALIEVLVYPYWCSNAS